MSHADTSRIKHRHAKNKRQISKATEIAKISINIITATTVQLAAKLQDAPRSSARCEKIKNK